MRAVKEMSRHLPSDATKIDDVQQGIRVKCLRNIE